MVRSMTQRCRPNCWLDSMPLQRSGFRSVSHEPIWVGQPGHVPCPSGDARLEIPAVMRVVSRVVTFDHGLQREAVVDVGAGTSMRKGSPFASDKTCILAIRFARPAGLGPGYSPL